MTNEQFYLSFVCRVSIASKYYDAMIHAMSYREYKVMKELYLYYLGQATSYHSLVRVDELNDGQRESYEFYESDYCHLHELRQSL